MHKNFVPILLSFILLTTQLFSVVSTVYAKSFTIKELQEVTSAVASNETFELWGLGLDAEEDGLFINSVSVTKLQDRDEDMSKLIVSIHDKNSKLDDFYIMDIDVSAMRSGDTETFSIDSISLPIEEENDIVVKLYIWSDLNDCIPLSSIFTHEYSTETMLNYVRLNNLY